MLDIFSVGLYQHLKLCYQQAAFISSGSQKSQWDYSIYHLLQSLFSLQRKLPLCKSSLILIAQKMPLHTPISHRGHWLPIFPIKDAVPLIPRSNPAPKSSETKCDVNHVSRPGHVRESDMIIWTGGGSERQSSSGRRVASFDLTAWIFPWPHDMFDLVWHNALGTRWGSMVW